MPGWCSTHTQVWTALFPATAYILRINFSNLPGYELYCLLIFVTYS